MEVNLGKNQTEMSSYSKCVSSDIGLENNFCFFMHFEYIWFNIFWHF